MNKKETNLNKKNAKCELKVHKVPLSIIIIRSTSKKNGLFI